MCHCPQHTHTHPFNGPLSGTTQVSQYQKGKTNLDFTEARDSEWQWHQLGHNASPHLAPDRQPHQHPTTGNVTSAGWQVILCDPIWHVSSCSGEASRELLYSVYFTLLTLLLCFLQAGCPSCRPTTSVKALKATKHCPQHCFTYTGWCMKKWNILYFMRIFNSSWFRLCISHSLSKFTERNWLEVSSRKYADNV